jgi:hypothetical protein
MRDKTHGRSLNDGNGLDNLFLVHLRTRSIKIADDGGHPGLVSHGSGEMDWFLGVILRKAGINVSASTSLQSHDFWRTRMYVSTIPLDLASMSGSSLSGEESKRAC